MYKRDDITLLYVLKDDSLNDRQKSYYNTFAKEFGNIIAIVRAGIDARWLSAKSTIEYTLEDGKVAGMNDAVKRVRTNLCMVMESDEYCLTSKLPPEFKPRTCYRAFIDVVNNESQRNYQVRIFPTPESEDDLFEGFTVPDINRSFQYSGWELADEIIPIHKSSPLFKIRDAEREIDEEKSKLMSLFWQAILDSEHQQYNRAEDKFRRVLKDDKLFEFDYLAALNGLANALVEQHKLEEASTVATKSLSVNNRQRSPYLTLYKVNKLSGKPDSAYKYLSDYLHTLRFASRANLDVSLSLSECHYLMANTTFKQGNYERAFHHFERFYELNDGQVRQPVLEKLFIYAIELENYDKSVQYFDDIFGDYIPDNLDDDMSARLLESLSLFMDNEWYDFVSDIYQQLVAHNPEDNKLLNGWITTLIKNKEIEKAQELLGQKKAS